MLISEMVDKLTEKIPTVYFTSKRVIYDLIVLDFLGINRLVINSKQKTLTRGGLLVRLAPSVAISFTESVSSRDCY